MSKPHRCLPTCHPTAHVFVDESGTARQSRILAVGALKFRGGHGPVFTELQQFRQRSGWRKEAHFVDLATKNAHIYREAVRILTASDAQFTCLVADCDDAEPGRKPEAVAWKVHAQLAIALLGRVINGAEIVSVTLDDISLPAGVNYESYVRQAVNRQKDRLAVATVSRMDSRACWGIQMTDVLTGAVAHQYRQQFDPRAKAGSAKGAFAAFVAEQFNLSSLVDAESRRVHVVGHGGARRRRAHAVTHDSRLV
jgi:hypothetical protein